MKLAENVVDYKRQSSYQTCAQKAVPVVFFLMAQPSGLTNMRLVVISHDRGETV